MIVSREAVRQAVARALVLDPGDTEAAIAAAAQSLGLPVEVVAEVVAEGETA